MSNKRRKNTKKKKGEKDAREKEVNINSDFHINIRNNQFNNDETCTSCNANKKYRHR